jgi:hypothetical protein
MWNKVGSLAGSNGHYQELHNGIVSAQRGPAGAVLPAERRFIVPSRLVRATLASDGPSPDLTQWPPFTAALALVRASSVCSA